jgi:homoserine dehydrogenase
MIFDIAFIGFGTVGRGLADLLLEKKDALKRQYGIEHRVVAISDMKAGSILDDGGLDLREAVRLADSKAGLEAISAQKKGLSALETIRNSAANVVVEATWTNLVDGEPGYSHMRTALSLGKHVVTTNKGPIALHYQELKKMASEKGARLKFKGTVLSGTPAQNLFDGALAGCSVSAIRGIVNGTTNFILTEMENGHNYADSLREAQRLGYAEADPTMDVEGGDAAAKITILANALMGADLKPNMVERKGIASVTRDEIVRAKERGERIKLLARASGEGKRVHAEVSKIPVPISDPLANVQGVTNAITFDTDCLGSVTVVGPGAGRRATGYALLTDLISIAQGH